MTIDKRLRARGYLLFVVPLALVISVTAAYSYDVHVLYTAASTIGVIVGTSLVFEMGSLLRGTPTPGRYVAATLSAIGGWYLMNLSVVAARGQVELVPPYWSFWLFPVILIIVSVVDWHRKARRQT